MSEGVVAAPERSHPDLNHTVLVVLDCVLERVDEVVNAGPIEVAVQQDARVVVMVGEVRIHDVSRGARGLNRPAERSSRSVGVRTELRSLESGARESVRTAGSKSPT